MTVSLAEVARQLQVLRDIEEIKRLKYAYFRCVDTANLAELAGLVHPAVTTCYVGGSYRIELSDREEFLDMVANAFHAEVACRHQGHHPEIDILSEQEATGIWYLHDVFVNLRERVRTEGTALYRDRYVKQDGRWLIRHQSYERIYEIVEPITTPPNLTAHYLASHGRRLP